MSGFFGMIRENDNPVEERFLEEIAQQLSFRGPDGKSVCSKPNVGGCFTLMRTAAAPQASQQPMIKQNRYWQWGDVRLDARQELQKQLAENEPAAKVNATNEELLLRTWEKWDEHSPLSGGSRFPVYTCKEQAGAYPA